MAGSRGPQAEMVIPPSPNPVVIVHRQRASFGRSLVTNTSSVTVCTQPGGCSRLQAENLPLESITHGSRKIQGRRAGAAAPGSTASGRRRPRRDRGATGSAGHPMRRSPARRRRPGRCPPRCGPPAALPRSARPALPQRAEPVAHELPGDGVLFLQRVGGERRVQLDQAGDRPVPLGGLDHLADRGARRRVRVARNSAPRASGRPRPAARPATRSNGAARCGTPRSRRRPCAATRGPPHAARTARSRSPGSAACAARLSGKSGALAGLRCCRSPRHRRSRPGRAAAAGAGHCRRRGAPRLRFRAAVRRGPQSRPRWPLEGCQQRIGGDKRGRQAATPTTAATARYRRQPQHPPLPYSTYT